MKLLESCLRDVLEIRHSRLLTLHLFIYSYNLKNLIKIEIPVFNFQLFFLKYQTFVCVYILGYL